MAKGRMKNYLSQKTWPQCFPFSCGLVSAEQLAGGQGESGALICSSCWCKYSHHGLFQATYMRSSMRSQELSHAFGACKLVQLVQARPCFQSTKDRVGYNLGLFFIWLGSWFPVQVHIHTHTHIRFPEFNVFVCILNPVSIALIIDCYYFIY